MAVLKRLTEVDGLERFLGRAYRATSASRSKGTTSLVPMLDETIARGANGGAREVVIGMAHRGRINVLVHVMGMSYVGDVRRVRGAHRATRAPTAARGDVKYHLGYRRTSATVGEQDGVARAGAESEPSRGRESGHVGDARARSSALPARRAARRAHRAAGLHSRRRRIPGRGRGAGDVQPVAAQADIASAGRCTSS